MGDVGGDRPGEQDKLLRDIADALVRPSCVYFLHQTVHQGLRPALHRKISNQVNQRRFSAPVAPMKATVSPFSR